MKRLVVRWSPRDVIVRARTGPTARQPPVSGRALRPSAVRLPQQVRTPARSRTSAPGPERTRPLDLLQEHVCRGRGPGRTGEPSCQATFAQHQRGGLQPGQAAAGFEMWSGTMGGAPVARAQLARARSPGTGVPSPCPPSAGSCSPPAGGRRDPRRGSGQALQPPLPTRPPLHVRGRHPRRYSFSFVVFCVCRSRRAPTSAAGESSSKRPVHGSRYGPRAAPVPPADG